MMKKLIKGLMVGSICALSANADFLLELINSDGTQSSQCIKSYSFSNNLESIAKQKGVGQDVYSKEEIMTNKVYYGKPVYRQIFPLSNFVVSKGQSVVKQLDLSHVSIDKVLNFNYSYDNNGAFYDNYNDYVIYEPGKYTFTGARYLQNDKKAWVQIVQKHPTYTGSYNISEFKFIIEYTKTTDTAVSTTNEFKSYLHYIPSSSTSDELINVNMKDVGVRFLEGYAYDVDTDSCIKN